MARISGKYIKARLCTQKNSFSIKKPFSNLKIMKEIVTIIITVYNGEQYLAKAIESVLVQTYREIELILVNDGSKDKSLEIIQEYAAKDERTKVIDQENKGICAANNAGLAIAQGKYYAKLDADDTMHTERIERQVAYLESHPEVTMLSCQAYYINPKGKRIGVQITPGYTKVEDSHLARESGELIIALHSGFMTYMDKMQEIKGYREELKCMVDLDLYTRLVEKGGVMIIMPDKFINYRMHLSSVMALTSKNNMTQKTRAWLRDSYKKKARGIPEQSFKEFEQKENQVPFLAKWNRQCKEMAYHYRRNSIIHYGDSNYVPFVYSVGMATLLQPIHTLGRVGAWVKRKLKK
jgi:glycosyltransferase involved in cell wall biosynthesis